MIFAFNSPLHLPSNHQPIRSWKLPFCYTHANFFHSPNFSLKRFKEFPPSETLPAVPKSVGKFEIAVKIRPFKGLQNGIENPTELLEKLKWYNRREHKSEEPTDPTERQS